jgi:competence ComEA-like helix-hairpin-helix protein
VPTLLLTIFALTLSAQENLPDTNLPEAKEKATFVKMCSNCHAIERVVKVRFSKKFWASTVDDMVSRGAEGTEEEVESVISYLTRYFGKPVNINTATAKQIEAGLSFKPAEAEALIKHRTDNGPIKTFEDLAKITGLNAKLLTEQKNNIQF